MGASERLWSLNSHYIYLELLEVNFLEASHSENWERTSFSFFERSLLELHRAHQKLTSVLQETDQLDYCIVYSTYTWR